MTVLTVPTSVVANSVVMGSIKARDAYGVNRTSGGDPFSVELTSAAAGTRAITPTDGGDGTYAFSFTAPPYLAVAPTFTLEVLLNSVVVTSTVITLTPF